MSPLATQVRHIRDYELEVTFANGHTYRVPLWDEVISKGGELAKPLRDVAYFKKVRVPRGEGVLQWPNGFDICPDILYWLASGEPISWSTDPRYRRAPEHLKARKPRKRRNRAATASKR
jgi:hypothetical protein